MMGHQFVKTHMGKNWYYTVGDCTAMFHQLAVLPLQDLLNRSIS